MKRSIVFVTLWSLASAHAAPFLYADPYPSTATQPDSASLSVNGGAPISCLLEMVTGGKRPKCDLASITSPGTYTLVMTVSVAGGIVNGTNTATNTQAGSASSAPFSYTLKGGSVATPVLSVGP